MANSFHVPKISTKTEGTLAPGNPLEPKLIMTYEKTDVYTGEPFEFEEIVYTESHANFDKVMKDCAKEKKTSNVFLQLLWKKNSITNEI